MVNNRLGKVGTEGWAIGVEDRGTLLGLERRRGSQRWWHVMPWWGHYGWGPGGSGGHAAGVRGRRRGWAAGQGGGRVEVERGRGQRGRGQGPQHATPDEGRGCGRAPWRGCAPWGRVDALLLLAPVAEPDPDHLFLHGEALGEHCYLLGRGLGVLHECLLERHTHARLDAGALLAAPADRLRRGVGVGEGSRVVERRVRILEPSLQQRLQLAHVLEAQVERLEPGDGGLAEVIAIQLSHSQAHISLCETELDPPLLERFGKLLELFQVRHFFWTWLRWSRFDMMRNYRRLLLL